MGWYNPEPLKACFFISSGCLGGAILCCLLSLIARGILLNHHSSVMSRILQEIESKIGSIRAVSPTRVHVGVVQEVGDGVAQIDGLSRVVLNEMLEFPRGEVGLALNLEETSIGAIILGDYTSVREGDEVRCTGKLLQIPVGLALLGRVVNALGVPIDGKGPISTEESYPLERNAPSIIQRQPVTQSLQTGIISIDAMIPIGRGQRQLIIGDRSTGKTTIALDTILNQAVINRTGTNDPNFRPVYSVYVAIGQKNASIARVISILESRDALRYTVVVCATASESATVQYIAPFAGMSMGEWRDERPSYGTSRSDRRAHFRTDPVFVRGG